MGKLPLVRTLCLDDKATVLHIGSAWLSVALSQPSRKSTNGFSQSLSPMISRLAPYHPVLV